MINSTSCNSFYLPEIQWFAMHFTSSQCPMRIISDKSYISFFTPMKSMKFFWIRLKCAL